MIALEVEFHSISFKAFELLGNFTLFMHKVSPVYFSSVIPHLQAFFLLMSNVLILFCFQVVELLLSHGADVNCVKVCNGFSDI
jgi:hypothetical protein